ncbi:hypothetical protein Drorol1_Dr00012229 [Drosera rotundifolia]
MLYNPDVEGLPAAALGLAAQMAVFKCGLMIIIFIIISNDTKPHKCYSREWAMANPEEPGQEQQGPAQGWPQTAHFWTTHEPFVDAHWLHMPYQKRHCRGPHVNLAGFRSGHLA